MAYLDHAGTGNPAASIDRASWALAACMRAAVSADAVPMRDGELPAASCRPASTRPRLGLVRASQVLQPPSVPASGASRCGASRRFRSGHLARPDLAVPKQTLGLPPHRAAVAPAAADLPVPRGEGRRGGVVSRLCHAFHRRWRASRVLRLRAALPTRWRGRRWRPPPRRGRGDVPPGVRRAGPAGGSSPTDPARLMGFIEQAALAHGIGQSRRQPGADVGTFPDHGGRDQRLAAVQGAAAGAGREVGSSLPIIWPAWLRVAWGWAGSGAAACPSGWAGVRAANFSGPPQPVPARRRIYGALGQRSG